MWYDSSTGELRPYVEKHDERYNLSSSRCWEDIYYSSEVNRGTITHTHQVIYSTSDSCSRLYFTLPDAIIRVCLEDDVQIHCMYCVATEYGLELHQVLNNFSDEGLQFHEWKNGLTELYKITCLGGQLKPANRKK